MIKRYSWSNLLQVPLCSILLSRSKGLMIQRNFVFDVRIIKEKPAFYWKCKNHLGHDGELFNNKNTLKNLPVYYNIFLPKILVDLVPKWEYTYCRFYEEKYEILIIYFPTHLKQNELEIFEKCDKYTYQCALVETSSTETYKMCSWVGFGYGLFIQNIIY